MKACPYPVAELLPHAPPMVLLDEVLGYDGGRLQALVTIRDDSMFCRGDGVPAHIAIEYMAQACGALAGIEARSANRPVRVGFLLGTRNFQSARDFFLAGERLLISVDEVFRDVEMGVFDGRVSVDDATLVTATLNVYQPQDMDKILRPDQTNG
jgi:predicted hotdog family 3-hydroxylacyl-ACP dehydratase